MGMRQFVEAARAAQARMLSIPQDTHNISSSSPYTNWVIPSHLLCGPYPGLDGINFRTAPEAQENMDRILSDGIDAFICLQEEEEVVNNLPRYASMAGPNVTFVHLPVPDGSAPPHRRFIEHLTGIVQLILQGRKVYLHCAGGHGRTGTYVAAILQIFFRLGANEALYMTQYLHNTRRLVDKRAYGSIPPLSPATESQFKLVRDMETLMKFVNV